MDSNVDGDIDETAVLPYYMPAMLSEGLENTRDMPIEDRERALSSLMRYLARVLDHSNDDETDGITFIHRQPTGNPGIVIERNVKMARDTISSGLFRTNPKSLDELPIPKGEVLKRRRTSYSM